MCKWHCLDSKTKGIIFSLYYLLTILAVIIQLRKGSKTKRILYLFSMISCIIFIVVISIKIPGDFLIVALLYFFTLTACILFLGESLPKVKLQKTKEELIITEGLGNRTTKISLDSIQRVGIKAYKDASGTKTNIRNYRNLDPNYSSYYNGGAYSVVIFKKNKKTIEFGEYLTHRNAQKAIVFVRSILE